MERVRRVLARNPSDQEARYFVAELATVTSAPDAITFIEPLVRESAEGRGDFLAESYRTQLARDSPVAASAPAPIRCGTPRRRSRDSNCRAGMKVRRYQWSLQPSARYRRGDTAAALASLDRRTSPAGGMRASSRVIHSSTGFACTRASARRSRACGLPRTRCDVAPRQRIRNCSRPPSRPERGPCTGRAN